MRASIIVVDDDGNRWEHELKLVAHVDRMATEKRPKSNRASTREVKPRQSQARRAAASPDFSLPVRPFIKRYTKGSSGPKKFAILVARITKGDVKTEVPSSEIEKQWNKMTQLMGSFHPTHALRAKDNGWVDSPKHGVYKLLSEWKDALPSA